MAVLPLFFFFQFLFSTCPVRDERRERESEDLVSDDVPGARSIATGLSCSTQKRESQTEEKGREKRPVSAF